MGSNEPTFSCKKGSSLFCITIIVPTNPCKCGYYPDRTRCFCTEHDILRYMGRISQPIWDRFDLNVKVNKVEFSMLSQDEEDNDSQMTS